MGSQGAGGEVVLGAPGDDLDRDLDQLLERSAGRPVTVLVDPPTVGATRRVLAAVAGRPDPVSVVGWADLTAPNLVDLLDELVGGPGGDRLAAVALRAPDPPPSPGDDPTLFRGLACLERSGLALRVLGPGGPALRRQLAAVEPRLLVHDDATATTAG